MAGLIGGLLSSLMGQNQNQTGSQSASATGSQTTSGSGQSTVNPNENPLFKMFRESILPAISQQYADAQKPVYGDAQRAQVMNQANEAGQGAETAISNNAARRGTLNAGSTDAASNAVQQGIAGQNVAFSNQIPFLNQQAKFGNTQNLLGLATSFLGQSPIGSTTSSNQQGQANTTQNQTGTSSSHSGSAPSLFGIPLG